MSAEMANQQSFQFHKGTIKTMRQPRAINASPLFQFHKGTIKTR